MFAAVDGLRRTPQPRPRRDRERVVARHAGRHRRQRPHLPPHPPHLPPPPRVRRPQPPVHPPHPPLLPLRSDTRATHLNRGLRPLRHRPRRRRLRRPPRGAGAGILLPRPPGARAQPERLDRAGPGRPHPVRDHLRGRAGGGAFRSGAEDAHVGLRPGVGGEGAEGAGAASRRRREGDEGGTVSTGAGGLDPEGGHVQAVLGAGEGHDRLRHQRPEDVDATVRGHGVGTAV